MPSLKDIQQFFPEPSQNIIRELWAVVPEEQRRNVQDAVSNLPLGKNPTRTMIDLALTHSQAVLGKHKNVAIIGPARGQIDTYNQFIRSDQDKAAVSPIPGTTRVNQKADAGIQPCRYSRRGRSWSGRYAGT